MAWTGDQHTIGQILQQQSLWTAQQMNRGYRVGITQHETTLTECNLVAIAEATWRLLTTRFLDESQTGADWQWETTRGIVVVQAKVQDLASFDYKQLIHQVGGGAYQVDLLRNYAANLATQPQTAGRPVRAYYVLYNSGPADQAGNFDPNDCGCFAVRAEDMNPLITQYVNAQRIGDTSLTWAVIKPKAINWAGLANYL